MPCILPELQNGTLDAIRSLMQESITSHLNDEVSFLQYHSRQTARQCRQPVSTVLVYQVSELRWRGNQDYRRYLNYDGEETKITEGI